MNKIVFTGALLLLLPGCVLLTITQAPCVDDVDCPDDLLCGSNGLCGTAAAGEGEGEEGEGEEGEGEEGEGEEGEGEEGEGEGEEGEGEGEGEGDVDFGAFDVEVDDDFAADDDLEGRYTTLLAAVTAVTTDGLTSPVILVRPGAYSESAPLTLPLNTTLRGASVDEFGNDVLVEFSDNAFVGPGFRLERLRLDTNGNAYVDVNHGDFVVDISHCALVDGDFSVVNNFAPAPLTHLTIDHSDLGDVDVFVNGGAGNGITFDNVAADDLNLQVFADGALNVTDSDLRVSTFRSGLSTTTLTIERSTLRETAGAFSCTNIIEAGAVAISESVFTFTHCPPLIVRDNNALSDVDVEVDFGASTGKVIINRELAGSAASLSFRDSVLPGGGGCGIGLCFCAESLDDTSVDLGGGTICEGEQAVNSCPTGEFPCD